MAIGFGALQSESPARNPVQLFNPALPLESVTMGNFLQDASSFCGCSAWLNADVGLLFGALRAVHSPLARSTR